MLMVSFTGDSLEKSSASLDTLKLDLAARQIGGVILFTWSNNLRSRGQILHLTSELRRRSPVPLLIATDQEGGRVARLGPSNGFAATPTAFELGSITKSEGATRSTAATMAGWLDSMGINVNLAPVADVNVNPSSPAIGALERSYSRIPDSVSLHAGWFTEEMHRRGVGTTLKHFPGHGSATTDSHLGLPDITATWSREELRPFATLIARGVVDAVMTGHLFNRTLDSTYPATLSRGTVQSLLRDTLGFQGVVISDEMNMRAITDNYGLDDAAVLAVNAGVDVLLYNRNLLTGGGGLARHLVDLIEAKVMQGLIPWQRIDQSYARIQGLKSRYATAVADPLPDEVPRFPFLAAYPNPFNASTTVLIRLADPAEVSVEVFDLLGRRVASLFTGPLEGGESRLRWDAGALASGTYFLRLTGAGRPVTARMLLLR
jgi:beta-N-acetylhexosaminidase